MNVRRTAAAGVAVVGGLLVLPAVASAHTASVSAACGEGLHVDVALYDEGVTTTVIIDGEVVAVTGGGTFTYDLGDPTKPHSYEVFVDGAGSDEFDRSFSDTVEACEQPETTEPPATEPPATEPPVTEPPAMTEPPVTEPPATTETSVAPLAAPPAEAPPAPPAAPQAASSQAQTLPATGSTSAGLVIAAAATLVAGVTMWLVSRRRRMA